LEGWTVFNWFAAREDVKKRIAELEERISCLRDALPVANGPVESTKRQRILVIREQELERTRFYAQFIDYQIAKVTAKMLRRGRGPSLRKTSTPRECDRAAVGSVGNAD
jgi:hypothetical protein